MRESTALRDISKYLGRFREMLAQKKQNGYAYGRGEKYSLELGGDLSRALTSELAMLATPETLPLFLRKYQRRQIKQYRRREPIYKGAGDIICCLDESGSTAGECAAWGKAVAMTLLEIAEGEGRRFALIHFSDFGTIKTDLFFPKQTTVRCYGRFYMAIDYKEIGSNIKVCRIRKNLKQAQLAEIVGVSSQHISHIECGRTTVSLPLLISIAQALSVDLYALLDGIVESRPKTSFGIEFENVLKDATPDQLTLCLSVCRTIMEHGKGSLTI